MWKRNRSFLDVLNQILELKENTQENNSNYLEYRQRYYDCLKGYDLCNTDTQYKEKCKSNLEDISEMLNNMRPSNNYYQHHSE